MENDFLNKKNSHVIEINETIELQKKLLKRQKIEMENNNELKLNENDKQKEEDGIIKLSNKEEEENDKIFNVEDFLEEKENNILLYLDNLKRDISFNFKKFKKIN